ncbi:unnamed protein product [Amoebophrya sp. A25]|nr:unnamed protein product [Amoebophrya sp. A25]|eukprot:GSA25T00010014001.1
MEDPAEEVAFEDDDVRSIASDLSSSDSEERGQAKNEGQEEDTPKNNGDGTTRSPWNKTRLSPVVDAAAAEHLPDEAGAERRLQDAANEVASTPKIEDVEDATIKTDVVVVGVGSSVAVPSSTSGVSSTVDHHSGKGNQQNKGQLAPSSRSRFPAPPGGGKPYVAPGPGPSHRSRFPIIPKPAPPVAIVDDDDDDLLDLMEAKESGDKNAIITVKASSRFPDSPILGATTSRFATRNHTSASSRGYRGGPPPRKEELSTFPTFNNRGGGSRANRSSPILRARDDHDDVNEELLQPSLSDDGALNIIEEDDATPTERPRKSPECRALPHHQLGPFDAPSAARPPLHASSSRGIPLQSLYDIMPAAPPAAHPPALQTNLPPGTYVVVHDTPVLDPMQLQQFSSMHPAAVSSSTTSLSRRVVHHQGEDEDEPLDIDEELSASSGLDDGTTGFAAGHFGFGGVDEQLPLLALEEEAMNNSNYKASPFDVQAPLSTGPRAGCTLFCDEDPFWKGFLGRDLTRTEPDWLASVYPRLRPLLRGRAELREHEKQRLLWEARQQGTNTSSSSTSATTTSALNKSKQVAGGRGLGMSAICPAEIAKKPLVLALDLDESSATDGGPGGPDSGGFLSPSRAGSYKGANGFTGSASSLYPTKGGSVTRPSGLKGAYLADYHGEGTPSSSRTGHLDAAAFGSGPPGQLHQQQHYLQHFPHAPPGGAKDSKGSSFSPAEIDHHDHQRWHPYGGASKSSSTALVGHYKGSVPAPLSSISSGPYSGMKGANATAVETNKGPPPAGPPGFSNGQTAGKGPIGVTPKPPTAVPPGALIAPPPGGGKNMKDGKSMVDMKGGGPPHPVGAKGADAPGIEKGGLLIGPPPGAVPVPSFAAAVARRAISPTSKDNGGQHSGGILLKGNGKGAKGKPVSPPGVFQPLMPRQEGLLPPAQHMVESSG